MMSLRTRNTQNTYSDAVARNLVSLQCRQSKCRSTVLVVNVGHRRWPVCHGFSDAEQQPFHGPLSGLPG